MAHIYDDVFVTNVVSINFCFPCDSEVNCYFKKYQLEEGFFFSNVEEVLFVSSIP